MVQQRKNEGDKLSFQIIKQIIDLDSNFDLHTSRILILLSKLGGRNMKQVKGMTKLVKLDFLLRYPTVLEYALTKFNASGNPNIRPHEKTSVESKMVRFRYGPWDPRYYQYLAILESKGLVQVAINNKAVEIQITQKGKDVAEKLGDLEEMTDFVDRSAIIHSNFGTLSATRLKDLMYELVPELHDMKFGEKIDL